MAKIRKKTGGKVRKKKWLKIIAPRAFNNMVLGESYVYDAKQLMGKSLKVNMMTLSRDPKQQHLNILFKVTKLDGDTGLAEVKGFVIVPSFLKRIVRRGKNRLDMSFKCKIKDKVIRIKPILLTRSQTHSSVLKDLRKTAIEIIAKAFANYKFDDLVMDLLAYKVQRKIKSDLCKIYPLKSCDIRSIKEDIVKSRKFNEEEPEENPEAVEEVKPVEEEVPAEEGSKAETAEETVEEVPVEEAPAEETGEAEKRTE